MDKRELRKLEDQLNRMFEKPEFQALLPRSPNMRYWKRKNEKYAYAWTTEKVKGKFYALKYRILKNGNWKLVKKAKFGKRKVAKARAFKWYMKGKESFSLA